MRVTLDSVVRRGRAHVTRGLGLIGVLGLLGTAAVSLTHPVFAGSLALGDSRVQIGRLAPGATNGTKSFLIDEADWITLDLVSTSASLETSITTPAGEIIDPVTVESVGGEFATFVGGQAQDSALIGPAGEPGLHHLYTFPSQGVGSYTAAFSSGPLTEEVAVIIQLGTLGPLGVALTANDGEVAPGHVQILTAAVFDGSVPIADAWVAVKLRDPSGAFQTLDLSDDGVDPDSAAGDGLYSVEITPTLAGEYVALGQITGRSVAGVAFSRSAVATFVRTERTSTIAGAFTDSGVDDDGDGLFEHVQVVVPTDTEREAKYALFVQLITSSGRNLVRTGYSDLVAGVGSIRALFPADELRELGEDGPYGIGFLELRHHGARGSLLADRRVDVGQTQTYLLSQLDRPELVLTGVSTDAAFDDDGNQRFDRLVVGVEVDALYAGDYEWSFKLSDEERTKIDTAHGEGHLTTGLNTMHVTFEGTKIGASRTSGPWLLRDLLLHGDGGSLVAFEVGRTSAYDVTDFEDAPAEFIAPILHGVPPNTSVSCDDVPPPADVIATDDSDPFPTVSLTEEIFEGPCFNSYTIRRTWTAVDASGNEADATQTIEVVDLTPPAFSGLPDEMTITGGVIPPPPSVIAADSCDESCGEGAFRFVDVRFEETVALGPCDAVFDVIRTWTAVDCCENVATATRTIHVVEDREPPVLSEPDQSATVGCAEVPAPPTLTATDECDPSPQVVLAETRVTGSCEDDYTLLRTFTATDRYGNATTTTFVVHVRDESPPRVVATLSPVGPAPASSASSGCAPRSSRVFHVACELSDNCDVQPSLTVELVSVQHATAGDGTCDSVVERIPVDCDELVEIQLAAPACAAGSARSAGAASGTTSQGMLTVRGESVRLTASAEDRCGNASIAMDDPSVLVCTPEQAPCCAAISAPARPECAILCGAAAQPSTPGDR